MVTLTKWKLNRTMVIWGLAFGVAATLSGMFILSSLQGGFVAEGFFLLVISWIFYIVLVAKILKRLKEGHHEDDF
jgi:hypothetical protein